MLLALSNLRLVKMVTIPVILDLMQKPASPKNHIFSDGSTKRKANTISR